MGDHAHLLPPSQVHVIKKLIIALRRFSALMVT